MFALASMHISDQAQKEHDLKVGADLTNTCHESYIRTGKYIHLATRVHCVLSIKNMSYSIISCVAVLLLAR